MIPEEMKDRLQAQLAQVVGRIIARRWVEHLKQLKDVKQVNATNPQQAKQPIRRQRKRKGAHATQSPEELN